MQALANDAATVSFGRLRRLLLMLGSHECCEVQIHNCVQNLACTFIVQGLLNEDASHILCLCQSICKPRNSPFQKPVYVMEYFESQTV